MDNKDINNQQINKQISDENINSTNQSTVDVQEGDSVNTKNAKISDDSVSGEKKKNVFLVKITEMWMKLNPVLRKVIVITGFIFGLLLLAALVFSVSTKTVSKVKITPTPVTNIEQSPLPEIIINPSRYATDSAVLTIEGNLKSIEKEIGGTVINDLKLAPPNLLWDINFED